MTAEQKAMRRAWAASHFGDKNLTDEELNCATYMPSENFSDGWDKGVDFALSHQWISVDERLPEDDETVLTHSNYGYVLAYYSEQDKMWFVYGNYGDINPTHWLPIPQLNPE
ncbi:MAG: DUF551 domain-containing protein [Paramuribaculum sp.]|nr:DUF551 domain-containing protein [Paramuribaculum sp.]